MGRSMGHITLGRVTVYGDNAMHFAVNVWTRWGFICFRPTTWTRRSGLNRWYFFISKNGTPWAATFGIGPGLSRHDKARIALNRCAREMGPLWLEAEVSHMTQEAPDA